MTSPRILAIDVGTGTQDILILEPGTAIENAVQMIMPSPTMLVAAQVRAATRDKVDLLLTGVTMGGGPGHWAVEAHLEQGFRVFATPDAARTFDDDLGRVTAMGVQVVDEGSLAGISARRIEFRDFEANAVTAALHAFGVSETFDAVAVAVFDHGAAPPGISDRRFRFEYLAEQVGRGARLDQFGYLAGEIPPRMTRMLAVARTWAGDAPLFVMDTGPAAVLGALDDPEVRAAPHICAVNVAGATILDDEITMTETPSMPLEHFLSEAIAGLGQREQVCRRGRAPLVITGRTVIVVDCGIRTGSTMRVAARAVRRANPQRMVGAVPVSSREGYQTIAPLFDDLICLLQPEEFINAGRWYSDFSRPEDEDVGDLL